MRKLLIGCGIVASGTVVLLIVAGMLVSSWFKSRFPDADKLEKRRAEILQRFGDPDDFVPPTDGGLPADRVATFVALRESLAVKRDLAADHLATLYSEVKRDRPEKRSTPEKISDALRLAQGSAAMLTSAFEYIGVGQRALMAAGMSPGEYDFYYALTTRAWLGFDPLAHAGDVADVRDEVREGERDLERRFERQLRNAQRTLKGKSTRTPQEEKLLQAVDEQLEAAASSTRVPFEAALPPGWSAALEPHRARLQAVLPSRPAAVLLDIIRSGSDSDHFRWQNNREWRRSPHKADSTLSL
jgi:hypothetical protein